MCDPPDDPCRPITCDPDTGGCVEGLVDNGAPCDTDDPCEAFTVCDSGECVGNSKCDDGNPCIDDPCDPVDGTCLDHVDVEDGTSCEDGNECSEGDECKNGVCISGPIPEEECGNQIDDDCNNLTDEEGAIGCSTFYGDDDGDGYGDDDTDTKCLCGPDGTYAALNLGDCDDGDADVNPGANEICNEKDDDCDGATDEEDAIGCQTFYEDQDDDGYGPDEKTKCLCAADKDFPTAVSGDCDDGDMDVNPEAEEACNGKDDDCDGATDEEDAQGCQAFYADQDDDGYGTIDDSQCLCAPEGVYSTAIPFDCNDQNNLVNPDADEACNGIDDDCDGSTDEEGAKGCQDFFLDHDQDGYGLALDSKCLCAPQGDYTATQKWDCNDNDSGVNPAADETCNEKDDDCDGATDEEGATGCALFYPDLDDDGYGPDENEKCLCAPNDSHSTQDSGDCDDEDADVNPAANEACNGKDDDCDGATDEEDALGCSDYHANKDEDGYGDDFDTRCLCAPQGVYSTFLAGDCDDGDFYVNPDADEACNEKDDDCDDITDEQDALGCTEYHIDVDDDGYGIDGDAKCLCVPQGVYSSLNTDDCDDTDPDVHPGGTVCGKDGDCDDLAQDTGESCDDVNTVPWDGCNACDIAEFQVNSWTTGSQDAPALALFNMMNDNGFVVAWHGPGCYGFLCMNQDSGIYAKRYLADGADSGTSIHVNAYTTGTQTGPDVAAWPNGFVVVWEGNGGTGVPDEVWGRRFQVNGVPTDDAFPVNQQTSWAQKSASVTATASGDFAVVWQSNFQDGDGYGVFARAYNDDGVPVGDEFQVNADTSGDQTSPKVAFHGTNTVVVWQGPYGEDDSEIVMKGFEDDWTMQFDETSATGLTSEQQDPDVAGFMLGGFVIVWSGVFSVDGEREIWARVWGQDLVPKGSAFRVNAIDDGPNHEPMVSTSGMDGGFVVVWSAQHGNGSEKDVLARAFGVDGDPTTGEIVVNTHIAGDQLAPIPARYWDGTFLVSWASDGQDGDEYGVFTQRLASDGTRMYR